jgi:hypothetical protein
LLAASAYCEVVETMFKEFLQRLFGRRAPYTGTIVIPINEMLIKEAKGLRYTVLNPSMIERSLSNILEADIHGVLILCRDTMFELMYALSIAGKTSDFNIRPTVILVKTTGTGVQVTEHRFTNHVVCTVSPEDFPSAFQCLIQAVTNKKLPVWRGIYSLRIHRASRGRLGLVDIEENASHILIFHPGEFKDDVEKFIKFLKISESLKEKPEPNVETIEAHGNSLTILTFQTIHS